MALYLNGVQFVEDVVRGTGGAAAARADNPKADLMAGEKAVVSTQANVTLIHANNSLLFQKRLIIS